MAAREPLEYEPDHRPPPFDRRRRVAVETLRVVGTIVGLLLLIYLQFAVVTPRWQRYRRQRQRDADLRQLLGAEQPCLVYTDSPDRVVLSNRAADAGQMTGDGRACRINNGDGAPGPGGTPVAWTSVVPAWREMLDHLMSPGSWPGVGTVFVHERHVPAGAARLVAVDAFWVGGPQGSYVSLSCRALPTGPTYLADSLRSSREAGSFWTTVSGVTSAGTERRAFRLYAGQIDPENPAVFTIRFVRTPEPGDPAPAGEWTITGTLHGDDTVSFDCRPLNRDATTQRATEAP